MNRQRLILFVLLIVLALAVTWSFFAMPRPRVAPPRMDAAGQRSTTARGAQVGKAPASALPSDARILRLELLDREQKAFNGYRRDLFRPIFIDELKVMQSRAAALKPVKPLQPLPPPPPPPPPVPPPSAAEERAKQNRQELGKFVFKGFLDEDHRKTIFLIKDGAIFLVKKGDILENRFKAASITDQALTIKVVDSGDEIVIPLLENLSLKEAP